jgi:hypothetical protein
MEIHWHFLNNLVNRQLKSRIDPHSWSEITENSLSIEAINKLISDGWKFSYGKNSRCDLFKIVVERGLKGYERDYHLFHETVHAWYDNKIEDVLYPLYVKDEYFDYGACKFSSEIITDWLALKARAKPELLRHTILSFGLDPQIYDQISYLAFCPNPVDLYKQREFPFAKDYFDKLRKVRMDLF